MLREVTSSSEDIHIGKLHSIANIVKFRNVFLLTFCTVDQLKGFSCALGSDMHLMPGFMPLVTRLIS